MTQPKRTRSRTPKPELTVEEFAFCEQAINGHFKTITEKYEGYKMDDDAYDFYFDKLAEWREVLMQRGGVTE